MTLSQSPPLTQKTRTRTLKSLRAQFLSWVSALALICMSLFGAATPASAADGDLRIGETDRNFGAIYAGTSASFNVTIENISATSMDLDGLELQSSAPIQMHATEGTCVGTLEPNERCQFKVNVHPYRADTRLTESITLKYSGDVTVFNLDVAVLNPIVVVDKTLDFGGMIVGQSKTLSVTVHNDSGLAIDFPDFVTPAADPFTVVNNCTAVGTLLADGICTLDYTYSPTTPGPAAMSGVIELYGEEFTLGLSATALVAPDAWVADPQLLAFEYIPVGHTLDQTFDIINDSDSDQVVPAFIFDVTAPFSYSTSCVPGETVAPGNSCTFTVTFSPTDPVYSDPTALLAFGDAEFAIALTGLGYLEPDFQAWDMTPLDLDFGEVTVGESKDLTSTLTFIGEGTGDIFPKDLDLGGPFTIVSSCADFANVSENDSCIFTVTFSPTAAGPATGSDTLRIYGDEFVLTAIGTGITKTVVDPDPQDPVGTPEPEGPTQDPEAEETDETDETEEEATNVVPLPTVKPTPSPVAPQTPSLAKTGADGTVTGLALTLVFLLSGALTLVARRRKLRLNGHQA